MGGIGGSKESSKPIFQQFPGLFGTPEGARIGTSLESLLGSGISGSPFRNPLEQAILNPQFGPTSASETALLKSIAEMTQGASALRGLGPSTPGALAQNLAPALIGLRQQQIGNLSGALGQDIGVRGQDIQGLIELAGLVMPQIVGGQKSSGKSGGLNIGTGGSGDAAAITALCWVAEELFGAFHPKTIFARSYVNSLDNWFTKLYRKYGRQWADWLHRHRWMKPVVQPIWEYLAFKGRRM